ncbi:hypothetical protein [Hymenobacter wooponensis]|uniref:Uncharacterized protein n=1 Tax=Hymenobacter wooponensis TaxID=1525360 RepID=A0A4Z0MEG2_9BACT|nr:hypothetical protein [Hymenobacter wooponensis]TGD77605.1 hypothetical protein EU557_22790 [Hymenobacter wooponensis]
MTKQDLLATLLRLDISPDSYTLAGGLPNEAFCLDHSPGKWDVYYSERGQKTGLVSFAEEDVACKYLLGTLIQHVYLLRFPLPTKKG